ncbi:MAG: orotidine-5'-phosphate decarboxylase [Chloroflexi bacterium]|nr:orotidine-5'-phosphate decarboxylase [Chloroflexota bacterium]
MTFRQQLDTACARSRSLLCVGLDPDPALLPVEDVLDFNRQIIAATHDLVCAYKPNLAFYEALGLPGLRALEQSLRFIRDMAPGVLLIADGKRGDVGNTAQAYARALFETWGFDAATVNPYGGRDSVEPFLEYRQRGVFFWCRSSNPGAGDLQDLVVASGQEQGQPLYQVVARRVQAWDRYENAGLVLGAPYPEELGKVRALCPETPFLIPGIGPQAGDLKQAVRLGTNAQGRRAVIAASRAVLYASRGTDFAQKARQAASALRDAINQVLAQEGHPW